MPHHTTLPHYPQKKNYPTSLIPSVPSTRSKSQGHGDVQTQAHTNGRDEESKDGRSRRGGKGGVVGEDGTNLGSGEGYGGAAAPGGEGKGGGCDGDGDHGKGRHFRSPAEPRLG
jgi:hypothetical protein